MWIIVALLVSLVGCVSSEEGDPDIATEGGGKEDGAGCVERERGGTIYGTVSVEDRSGARRGVNLPIAAITSNCGLSATGSRTTDGYGHFTLGIPEWGELVVMVEFEGTSLETSVLAGTSTLRIDLLITKREDGSATLSY